MLAAVRPAPPALHTWPPPVSCVCFPQQRQCGPSSATAMSRSLHHAVLAGTKEEVIARINMGEDVDAAFPPR